jgi:putative tricarboxylic transport membrane protein
MDLTLIDYVLKGLSAVFLASPVATIFGIPLGLPVVMIAGGLVTGIVIGAIPGLSGPFAMAVSLPILISTFGFTESALLPTLGFMLGIMKGATLGGAVPAILFNTPGTPDSYLTTLDGYPMTRKGQGAKALRVAHFSCVCGDTFSDIVLITCAPFLAVLVERYLDLPEKGALILLSMAFIAAAVGESVAKGLLSALFGMLVATIGEGQGVEPRLTMGISDLASGFSVLSVVLGVLILGEVFQSIEDLAVSHRRRERAAPSTESVGEQRLGWQERLSLMPIIGRSALIGTIVGALPGIGSTLAATLGYAIGKRRHKGPVPFGEGAPEGIAATEAANSAVSGSNLIPVLSLGIPGNVAAVFILLAIEAIGGLNPGPSVFRLNTAEVNPELVMVIGLFVIMMLGNLLNWTLGGVFMRHIGILRRVPAEIMFPLVVLITVAASYLQDGKMTEVYITLIFGVVGYLMRKLRFSVLAFTIAYVLAGDLERILRQGFEASAGDPFFLFSSPISIGLLVVAVLVATSMSRTSIGTKISGSADKE